MDDSLFGLVSAFFRGTWDLLTSINFPGTHLNFAVIALGSFLAVFSLSVISLITGIRFTGDAIRGGNNTRIRIPESRKDDDR